MTYNEFITLRKSGKVCAGIDTSTALRLVDYLPKEYQAAHVFWSWIWLLSIPVSIAVAVFIKPFWLGLLMLFVVPPMIRGAVTKSATQFVLEHAQENQEFFEKLVRNDLLVFKY